MADFANPIILKSPSSTQEKPLQATFLPGRGMNLISFKKGDIEVIDQTTLPLFEERFAGLGALIGPHFHRRNAQILPKIADESLFPHIARVKANGVLDPFSHGIGRYAPWQATATDNQLQATLCGKDLWNGVPLSALEGQQFKMNFQASLTASSLELDLSVVSDSDSLVGIHYYYFLPNGSGNIYSSIQRHCIGPNGNELPPSVEIDDQNRMTFDLNHEADFTFYPFPNPREASITLDTGSYRLLTTYSSPSQENCWQLYHPKGASYVCIEPISSQDPRHPNLTVSSIHISLSISV